MTRVRWWASVYYPTQLAAWLAARLWLRFRAEGREHVPASGPFVLVANHQSFLDPFLLGVGGRRAVAFLARGSLARFPPIRWWLKGVGAILIEREAPARSDLRKILESLDHGIPVAMFPEGTRSRDGQVGRFRRGLLFVVDRTGVPVVPAGLSGTFTALPRGRIFPRPSACKMRIGAPIPPAEVLASGGLERLRRTVAELAGMPLSPGPAEGKTPPDQVGAGRSPDSSDDEDSSGRDR